VAGHASTRNRKTRRHARARRENVSKDPTRFPIALHTYALGVEIERVIISRRLAPAGASICTGLSGTSRLAIMHASCAKKLIVIANRFPLAFLRSSCRVRFPSPRCAVCPSGRSRPGRASGAEAAGDSISEAFDALPPRVVAPRGSIIAA